MMEKKYIISNMDAAPPSRLMWLFEICVVCINVIGLDAKLYVISNGLLVLFFAGVGYMCAKNKVKAGRGLLYAVLSFAYMCLSVLWAYDSSVATEQLFSQFQLFILLFAVYETCMVYNDFIFRYIHAIYISAYLMIVFALYRYGGSSGFLATFSRIGRMGGIINGENGFGLIFAEGSIAALYYWMYKRNKAAIAGVFLFPLFAFSSGSRKAFFFTLIGYSILLIARYGFKQIYKVLIAAIIFVLMFYFLLQQPIFGTMKARLDQFFVGANSSDINRKEYIDEGLRLINGWRTIVGYGLDNYKAASGFGVYSHNNFIEVLVNFGIVGAIMYYLMYYRGLVALFVNARRHSIYIPLLIIFVLLMVMEYGMVTMLSKDTWILLGVTLAIADGAVINPEEE